ncbi:MAG TPA: nucleoside-diphosphate sugar epimerase/dehydratase [Candidatus Deferrimicrobium sp.]|nr:nucleoside-diphosphate sugar epimerase/dehydratase [Candidatus Deferrimicrobium sp.]
MTPVGAARAGVGAVRAGVGALQTAGRTASDGLAAIVLGLRGRHLFVIDLAAVSVSVYLALGLRHSGPVTLDLLASYLPLAVLPVLIRPVVNERFGLYRRLWRHASVLELSQVVAAVIAGTLVCVSISVPVILLGGPALRLPGSFWILELIVSLALIGGTRFGIRAVSELGTRVMIDGAAVSLTPTLLFGAGRAGAMTARSATRDPGAGVKPVGFLDEDPSNRGSSVAGLPVLGGLDDLEEAIRRTGARMLLITLSNPSGDTIRRVMERAREVDIAVRRVPPLRGLFDGTWDAHRVRDIRLEDLLTREQVTTHAPEVAQTISNQVVMVTGAGGSIGSELARQVYAFGPKRLVLVDRAESPLYMIQRELELRALHGGGGGELSIHLANVASRAIMSRIISETRPAVIFHAAAYKHVPMMEEHPSEGVQVNVGGTMAVLSAAVEARVPRFVLVSTDKAVEPSSVMGATKRLAEWLVADVAEKTDLAYVSVRFGNVLGSAGSVLPIFQSQLENGEPLTITHPEMTRYFMTMQEAGWLILDAAAIGRAGDLFVLDMGKPVKIADMALDLIRLTGHGDRNVAIRYTGLRPGEKLHEQLFYVTEKVEETGVDKILRVADATPPHDVVARARMLLELALGDRDGELRTALFDTVTTWSTSRPDAVTIDLGHEPGTERPGLRPAVSRASSGDADVVSTAR